MKKWMFIFLLVYEFVAIAQPQGFIKNYYGINGAFTLIDIDTTHDGGYVMCGYDYDGNGGDFIVIKADSLGNEQWRFTNNDFIPQTVKNDNRPYKIIETPQHDFVVIAQISKLISPNYSDIMFCKIDSLGNLIWKKKYNFSLGETASALNIFEDSTYLIAGSVYGGDNLIMKLNYFGDTIWTNKISQFGGGGLEPREILQFGNKYYFAGRWDSLTPTFDPITKPEILCTDSLGNLLWRNLFTDSVYHISDFRMSSNKKLYYAGFNTRDNVTNDATFSVFKLDTLGNLLDEELFHELNKDFSPDIFFNDSCLINYSLGSTIDSINLFKYDLMNQQNRNVVNYKAFKIYLVKCVINRKKEVLFMANYSDAGFRYGILVKTNQSFIGVKNIFFDEEEMTLYPNPANEYIEVDTEKLKEVKGKNTEAKIFDMQGKCLLSQTLKQQKTHRISIKLLPTGTYTIQLFNAKALIKSAKFIINH